MSVDSTASTNLDGNDDDKLRGSKKSSQTSIKMFNIGRELCFLLLIVFTTYASFNSSGSNGSGPPAVPFFPRGSLVGDFYKGDLADALLRASEGDVSFIMYYAPWDAESQVARKQFMAVAHQHYKQIYFAGINCWQPRSDCRRTLSKIQQYPKMVAYVTHETGVEYRGPREAQYMSNFLRGVMRPLHRLNTAEDLVRLRSAYNAVVVAFLNFKGVLGGPPYRARYETALKFLERDVRQEVAFSIVTSFKTTVELGGNRTPCIRLYLWNETLDYPGHFSSDSLGDWVTSRLHQVTLWLSPPGVKSLTLSPYISQGPALLMFTPFHNFVMYDLLREVGLEYYNCNNSSEVSELALSVSNHALERISQTRRSMLSCQSHSVDLAPTVQIVNNVWANSSCGKRRMFAQAGHARSQCYSHTAQCATNPPSSRVTSTSMLRVEQDPLSAPALISWARVESCSQLTPPPRSPPATPLTSSVRGLACQYNRSISLLALDSGLFSHFARGLGVDPDLAKDHTRVLMLNSQMETTHVLTEPITRASLSRFLVNFTEGKLERFQRSQPEPASSSPTPSPLPRTVSLMELTTDTFESVALNDSLNVVVMFHTKYCAFCHAVSHTYLTVARLLRSVPSLLFTRVDGENNDLPWQFTAPHYPSILFFPARRKAESRVFGAQVGVTVDSLSQFVLANLPAELRLLAMLQLCQRYPGSQWSVRRRECMADVRRQVYDMIAEHLSHYRKLLNQPLPPSQKRAEQGKLLTRLQHLRQLQMSVSVDSTRASQLVKQLVPQVSENKEAVRSQPLRDEL